VGAARILVEAQEHRNLADAIADCELVVGTTTGKNRELHQPLLQLKEAADVIRRQSGRVALLFGSEKRGFRMKISVIAIGCCGYPLSRGNPQ